MNLEEMKDTLIDLIKKQSYDTDMLDKIAIKHKMKLTIHYIISLGNYLDYLFSLKWDDDEYFQMKMEERYGVHPDYEIGLNA